MNVSKQATIYRVTDANGRAIVQGPAVAVCKRFGISPQGVVARARAGNLVKGLWTRELLNLELPIYVIVGHMLRVPEGMSITATQLDLRDKVVRYYAYRVNNGWMWTTDAGSASTYTNLVEIQSVLDCVERNKNMLDVRAIRISIVD